MKQKPSKTYLLKRMLGLVPLFFGITFLSFLVIHLAPGTPVDAQSALNPKMTLEAREKLTELYGLNEPLLTQYGHWLGRLLRFDFGRSFVDGEKVIVKIARTIPVTLSINLLSLFFIFLIGVPLGVLGAARQGSWVDKATDGLALAGFSVPTYWLALLLVSFFGVQFRLLPVSGLFSLFHERMSLFEKACDLAKHLALPVFVSSLTGLAGISRFMRSGMIHVLQQNYIRTARAKGLAERTVLYHHALRNALLPMVTILGLSIPGLLGGSVIFESIFSIPGMGRLFFNSVFTRDYPLIMAMLVIGAVLTLFGNFLADIGYRWLDPRIRFARSERDG